MNQAEPNGWPDAVTVTDTTLHTMGDVLMSELRHLPQQGESVILSGYRFVVESVTEKGIESIIAEPE